MGLDTRRPPLPAPTETASSMDDQSNLGTELATNVSRRTDKTSYSIPEDGSPITLSTQKLGMSKESGLGHHGRNKSQTSLLIEYFEGGKSGDKTRSRPSVRVKVTPSAARKSKHGNDAIQITGIGKDRKPSYTRRISLGSKKIEEGSLVPEGTEVSQSSESNLSGRMPIEIEVLNHNGSGMSDSKSSRGLMYAANNSDISSMPPDSMLEGAGTNQSLRRQRSRSLDREDETITQDHLQAPVRTRSRSLSKERITQKVMEKLGQGSKSHKSSREYKSGHERSLSKEYDDQDYPRERRTRSSKSHNLEADTVSGADSSIVSSRLGPSEMSYRSGTSKASSVNNPRLLEMVEDTIKRMILPEINALKEDQKTDRNMRSFEQRKDFLPEGDVDRDGYGLSRRVSKSSSSPNISSKPKVVLNSHGDDPGTVLSRGDSERKKIRKSSRESVPYSEQTARPSSRRSSGRGSVKDSYEEEEERTHSKHGKDGHRLRDAAAGGIVGGILTAAALKHHDSRSDIDREKRKRRSKSRSSRSRSNSIAETADEAYQRKEDIPPMPLASHINDSDITRDSILSVDTARPASRGSEDVRTPIREVSRGSVGEAMSPASRTPTRTPVSRGVGKSHSNQSLQFDSPNTISTRARIAALAAAGLGGAGAMKGVEDHREHETVPEEYGRHTPQRDVSPVQSVSSLKREEEDPLVPRSLRPQSAASRSSAGRLAGRQASNTSMRSAGSSPRTKLGGSRKQSQLEAHDTFITPMENAKELQESDYIGPGTPNGESVDDWYEREHQKNEQYRNSMEESTNRDSYQTNPYSSDEKRFTSYTEDSMGDPSKDDLAAEQDVRGIGANPEFVHTPVAVESAVASLLDPSTMSSHMRSSDEGSLEKSVNGTYSDRMSQHLREMSKDDPAVYEGSTISQTQPSQNRWAALRGHAQNLSGSSSRELGVLDSPRQSPAKSLREQASERSVKLGASAIPTADDQMPEIGHGIDDDSDLTTNPSIIQGPLGGDATGKDRWPYTPSPQLGAEKELGGRDSQSLRSGHGKDAALLGAGAGGAAALAAVHAHNKSNRSSQRDLAHQPSVEEDYEGERRLTPDNRQSGNIYIDRQMTPTSPANFRDEGYATDYRADGAITPKAELHRNAGPGQRNVDDYNAAMDAQDLGDDDPFVGSAKHSRHLSGNSHGMASPLYDSATGKGIDNIESKDIVALMDHLTVRDAQRNARDTEILVTLVRSAAEMRQSFDEMRRFIAEQDRMIMNNTDRDADITVQKVLTGPRPQPLGSPRTPRRQSQEDVQEKRKGVLRRALKGLTGGKSHNDLSKVEDMLMQILDNVEDLKHQGGVSRQTIGSYTSDSLDSYEKLRAAPDSGYEPEGQAGTGSTPNHSAQFSVPSPPRERKQFHSGYDGRRDSEHRVSTVLEGDEDELEPHESNVLSNQFENNERLLTPTQEVQRRRGLSPSQTPPQQAATFTGGSANELTPRAAEKQRKHKSNSSSIFGVPKISRWSKTTSSSANPDPNAIESPVLNRKERPSSEASRSGSALGRYDDDEYSLHDDDRLRSTQSLARDQDKHAVAEQRSVRSQASRISRTPSPLVPSEASYRHKQDEDELEPEEQSRELGLDFEDPKYQAHRNSLLLQHPQPRPGTTGRHQTHLETRAQEFGEMSTDSDLSQRTVSDFDPAQWGSTGTAALARNRLSGAVTDPMSPMSAGNGFGGRGKDEGPLIPDKPQVPPKTSYEEDDEPYEQNYSSGYGKPSGRMYYASPLGSGHLLEPIEEVSSIASSDARSLQASPEPQIARAIDMRSPQRKITGPRPMGTRSPNPTQARLVESNGTVRRKPVAKSQESFDSDTF